MMTKRGIILVLMATLSVWLVSCTGTSEGVQTISAQAYVEQYMTTDADHILVDVRTPREFNSGAISGAVNIPLQELDQRMSEFPDDKPIVIYCRSGNRSAQAANRLAENGYDELYDLGGTIQWTGAGYALQQPN